LLSLVGNNDRVQIVEKLSLYLIVLDISYSDSTLVVVLAVET
jgi:hypothetical protein